MYIYIYRQRCVLEFDKLHVSKNLARKAKGYTLTTDRDLLTVIKKCKEQHGRDCWIFPKLYESFIELYKEDGNIIDFKYDFDHNSNNNNNNNNDNTSNDNSSDNNNNNDNYNNDNNNNNNKLDNANHYPGNENSVKLHSFELWKDDILVAGEIGFTVGDCYLSLTGFSDRSYSSAGTIQMVTMALYLMRYG